MDTPIVILGFIIFFILRIHLIFKTDKKYYIGKIIFKRIKSNTELARTYYFFDVASNGLGTWETYTIEVGEGAYGKFNIEDEILILI